MLNEPSICRPTDPGVLLRPLIELIGESGFRGELLKLLNRTCGADHCAIFSIDGLSPTELAAASLDGTDAAHLGAGIYVRGQFWRRDPTMSAARELGHSESPNLFRLDIAALQDTALREIVYPGIGDRLLLTGPTRMGRLALSILKSGGGNRFGGAEMTALTQISLMLLTIVGKHARTVGQQQGLLRALRSLKDIESSFACIAKQIPRRESEVCARYIFGMSSAGIALDLSIGEETVATYRKRLYERLGICTQREMFVWYVSSLLKASADQTAH